MTDHSVSVTLTTGQAKRLAQAAAKSSPIKLLIKKSNTTGNHKLFISERQATAFAKALRQGKGISLSLTTANVKKSLKHGGFLPLLGMLVPALAPILGAVGSKIIDKITGSGLKKGRGYKLEPYLKL